MSFSGGHRWGSALLVGAVVVGGSADVAVRTPAPVYSAAVRLLGTTLGVGGSFDGFGLSMPLFFYGTAVPAGDSFRIVPYPAQINLDYPIISDLPGLSDIPYWPQLLTQSAAVGAGYLERDIAAVPAGEKLTIIGMSQGSQVTEIARADMAKDPNYVANADDYEFVMVGDPYTPNGGILARFSSWNQMPILGDLVPFGRPGPADSPFKTTYYQNQYDGFADFPAYFNVPAALNAVFGIVFQHMFPGYVLESRDEPNAVSTTVGNTTYVTIPQRLPLLAPLRLAASLIGAQRLVDALDPILRVFIEMGYERTADPSAVKEFGWSIPDRKVQEAIDALPDAFAQSLAILGGAGYMPTLPVPDVAANPVPTPVVDHPAIPVDTSPFAQAIRQAVVGLTGVLTALTTSVAKLLRILSGQPPAAADTAPVDAAAPALPPRSAAPARPAVPAPAATALRAARVAALQTRAGQRSLAPAVGSDAKPVARQRLTPNESPAAVHDTVDSAPTMRTKRAPRAHPGTGKAARGNADRSAADGGAL